MEKSEVIKELFEFIAFDDMPSRKLLSGFSGLHWPIKLAPEDLKEVSLLIKEATTKNVVVKLTDYGYRWDIVR